MREYDASWWSAAVPPGCLRLVLGAPCRRVAVVDAGRSPNAPAHMQELGLSDGLRPLSSWP